MKCFAGKTILIADSHLSGDEEEKKVFFRMLAEIRESTPKCIVFLGDIFELWIALAGYENELHREFLAFCNEVKNEFPIYFIEGNHEFYLRHHRKKFTLVDSGKIALGKSLFLHGDTINKADWKYASLRLLIRNFLTSFFLRLLVLSWGVEAVNRIRLILKPSNKTHKSRFPYEASEIFLRELSASRNKKITRLFTGHFHTFHKMEFDGIRLFTIPAWDMEKCTVGIWDEEMDSLQIFSRKDGSRTSGQN